MTSFRSFRHNSFHNLFETFLSPLKSQAKQASAARRVMPPVEKKTKKNTLRSSLDFHHKKSQ
jgi:hypothetical protein